MRKMLAAELLVFATTLAVNRGMAADEATTLATVTVNATYSYTSVSYNFGWNYNGPLRFSSPQLLGQYPGAVQLSNYHALNCAKAYTTTGPGANKGPRPGYYTFIVSNYGWRGPDGAHYETLTDKEPVADAIMLGGSTQGLVTMVFLPLNRDTTSLVRTISHEWAHQWGAQDLNDGSANDAYAIGDAAKAAYLADKGAKCGGL